MVVFDMVKKHWVSLKETLFQRDRVLEIYSPMADPLVAVVFLFFLTEVWAEMMIQVHAGHVDSKKILC